MTERLICGGIAFASLLVGYFAGRADERNKWSEQPTVWGRGR